MSDPDIGCTIADGVATITLNRPARMNAITLGMAQQLDRTVRDADADPSVRCVIITGAGAAFSSGDDTAQWREPDMATLLASFADVRPGLPCPLGGLLDCVTPTIAAVNGPALGAGMDIALVCDMRIASTDASFAQLYVRHGLTPHIGGLWSLPQLVGPALAAELLFTGRTVDAAEAAAIGLVSRVVEPAGLLEAAHELAQAVAAQSPLSMRYIKEGLRRGINAHRRDVDDLAAFASNALSRVFAEQAHLATREKGA